MAVLRIEKVLNTLPAILSPDTMYFVKLSDGTVETHVTDSAGVVAHLVSTGTAESIDPFLLMGAS